MEKTEKTQKTKMRREKEKKKEVDSFDAFMQKAGGRPEAQMKVGPFIKGKIPGGWSTVGQWLKMIKKGLSPGEVWGDFSNQIKRILRQYFADS